MRHGRFGRGHGFLLPASLFAVPPVLAIAPGDDRAIFSSLTLAMLDLVAGSLVALGLLPGVLATGGGLNQEHHQEGDDRRSGVDDQLPCFRDAKSRPRDSPCKTTDFAQSANAQGRLIARATALAIASNVFPIMWP